jgi:glycosyltransferase involved in cell wall biosynthesis
MELRLSSCYAGIPEEIEETGKRSQMTRKNHNSNRFLLITTISGRGTGLFSRPYLMAKQLKALEMDFVVVTFGFPITGLGTPVFNIPIGHTLRFGNLPEILQVSRTLSKIVERVKPEVIIAHQPPNIIASALGDLSSNVSIIGDLHSLSSIEFKNWGMIAEAHFFRLVEFLCTKVSEGLTVASPEIRDALISRGVNANKMRVVPNCVDTDEFYPIVDKSALKSKLGLPSAEIVAFTAPRSFTANVLAIYHLYKVARLLQPKMPGLRFLILGGGEVVTPVPPNVQYSGFVDNLNMFLNACDLAIAPYPKVAVCSAARNKILEYWSCGLPVISTHEGLRGLGEPSNVPVLVCEDDPEKIAESIATLANDAARKKELGQASREFVVRMYDWRRLANVLGDAFSDILSFPA